MNNTASVSHPRPHCLFSITLVKTFSEGEILNSVAEMLLNVCKVFIPPTTIKYCYFEMTQLLE